jgi:hypothetical protein
MTWIGAQQLELAVGQFADAIRQLPLMKPELRSCEVIHGKGVQRPALKSSSARRAASSRRPARMSASICRSH